jgi:hypothetical protein
MTTLSRLLASSALTLAVGIPATAATPGVNGDTQSCALAACVMALADAGVPARVILVDDDEDEDDDDDDEYGDDDDGDGVWFFVDEDHDEGEDCEDDDDDGEDGDDDDDVAEEADDDDGCVGGLGNAAPAGTVAPPANGLFGTGAPPVAVTN